MEVALFSFIAGSRQTRNWSKKFTLQPKGLRWSESNRHVYNSPHTYSHLNKICNSLSFPVYSQICGDYLLSKMDSQNAISFRNFASSMGDARLLDKVDAFIQDHLLEVSEQEDFLKLPRLKASSHLHNGHIKMTNGEALMKRASLR